MEPFHERLIEEKQQLEERIKKLDSFLNGDALIAQDQKTLLQIQRQAMGIYITCLNQRLRLIEQSKKQTGDVGNVRQAPPEHKHKLSELIVEDVADFSKVEVFQKIYCDTPKVVDLIGTNSTVIHNFLRLSTESYNKRAKELGAPEIEMHDFELALILEFIPKNTNEADEPTKYVIENLKDNTYQVVSYGKDRNVWYQGSLGECELWREKHEPKPDR